MKCDHIRTRKQGDTPFFPNMLNNGKVEVCLKEDVDAAIAELKAENKRLKATPEQIMKEVFDKVLIYPHDMVRLQDAYRLAVSLRKAKRALYKACANWADAVAFEETEGIGYDNSVAERWRKMERKCIKKAEEYK